MPVVPPVDQVPKFRLHHVRGQLDPIAMAGQHPFEAIVREFDDRGTSQERVDMAKLDIVLN